MSHSYSNAPSSSAGEASISATTSSGPNVTSNTTVNAPQTLATGTYQIKSGDIVVTSTNTPTNTKEKQKPKNQRVATPRRPPPTIDNFWQTIISDVRGIYQVDAKHQALPLARIKKIMKLDENSKMIAAEAPLLFAKACEYFIQELTMRAWVHTEENKRRTLQRSDIAQAIAGYDQFDFLIDIVPREDIKISSSSGHKKDASHHNNSTSTNAVVTGGTITLPVKMENVGGDVLTFGTLNADALAVTSSQPQHAQLAHSTITHAPQQFQIIQQPSATQPNQMQYFIAAHDPLTTTNHGHNAAPQQQLQIIQQAAQPQYFLTTHQPQQLILTTGPNGQLTATPAPTHAAQQQATILQNLAQHQQQQQQQQSQPHFQLLQQVVTPTGELTNVPIAINANQLNLLRLQMQPTATQQLVQLNPATNVPVTTSHNITAAQIQAQTHLAQQQQHHQGNTGPANIFISTAPHVTAAQVPQQQQTQLINLAGASIVTTDRTLGNNFRQNC